MAGKAPQWYAVQVSDTTMLLIASLRGQQKYNYKTARI